MKTRRILLQAHLILGCVAAPFLAVAGLTGAVLVFEDPLSFQLDRQLVEVAGTAAPLTPAELSSRLEGAMPGYRVVSLAMPGPPNEAWRVRLATVGGDTRNLLVDPGDGRVLGDASRLTTLVGTIHQFHTRLLVDGGSTVVGWAGVMLVILSLTGLLLWWPGKILWVKRTASGRRLVFELHSALGGATWLFLLLLGLTGVTIHWSQPVMSLLAGALGETLPGPVPKEAPGCDSLNATVPLASLMQTAMAAAPGARPSTGILDSKGGPARVILKYPEDHTPAGRTNIFLSPCTGAILEARSSRTAPAAFRAVSMYNREIHTGDLWGWPTRILAALVSLSLPVMALTGPLIWWNRRRRSVVPREPSDRGIPASSVEEVRDPSLRSG